MDACCARGWARPRHALADSPRAQLCLDAPPPQKNPPVRPAASWQGVYSDDDVKRMPAAKQRAPPHFPPCAAAALSRLGWQNIAHGCSSHPAPSALSAPRLSPSRSQVPVIGSISARHEQAELHHTRRLGRAVCGAVQPVHTVHCGTKCRKEVANVLKCLAPVLAAGLAGNTRGELQALLLTGLCTFPAGCLQFTPGYHAAHDLLGIHSEVVPAHPPPAAAARGPLPRCPPGPSPALPCPMPVPCPSPSVREVLCVSVGGRGGMGVGAAPPYSCRRVSVAGVVGEAATAPPPPFRCHRSHSSRWSGSTARQLCTVYCSARRRRRRQAQRARSTSLPPATSRCPQLP